MNSSPNQFLTEEKYEQIKTELQNENLEKFPSLFQQARNLAKQAWVSGIDVARGKPLLSSAEKAAARLEVCKMCEFLNGDRCTKCGCFMNAKVHIESTGCPINKWGAELQKIFTEEQVDAMNQARQNQKPPMQRMLIDLNQYPKDVATEINDLAIDSLNFDGRFSHKSGQYLIAKQPDGSRALYKLLPRQAPV